MGLLDNTTQQAYYDGNDHGNYQFTSLDNIINQFIIAYVGENKIIPKTKRTDVAFHAQRALQELSFDTLKSCKAQEITVPATLQMTLPQDYVNYTKVSWVDSSGIKHVLYPTSKTSNPSFNPLQNSDGEFKLQAIGDLVSTNKNVVLDGEYKDIVVGMQISGAYIPPGTVVHATSNASGITTIEMADAVGAFANLVTPKIPFTSTDIANSGTTLTFTKTDESLVLPQKSSHTVIVENLDWTAVSGSVKAYQISADAAADIVNVKIGMLVSHEYFPVGTKVVNVYDTTIVVDQLPSKRALTNSGEITFVSPDADTDTWSNYKSATPSENQDDYQDDTYWPLDGERYGLDPQHAQANGSFYIDCVSGKIHFSSNISGKTVILDYISDSLGTDAEMQVHKFAEEAMYKHIAYAILSTSSLPIHQQLAPRFKKEKFATTRQAKLRLSNLKLEELTQILRGKSKQIKH